LKPTEKDREYENPLVYVVILNWNNAGDTLECLKSLEQIDYQPYVPIVVDNGSSDGSVEIIRAAFPDIRQIELDTNQGYAAGNNHGIEYALKEGADYVLVLNNDTLVEKNMLRNLVDLAEAGEGIGMVGPKMYCYRPADMIFALGSSVNWSRGETVNRGMFLKETEIDASVAKGPVDFIAGCCVLVSRQMLEEVGLLDPVYYLNYEDVDWGVRASRAGFEIWLNPEAVLWHKVSATMGQASPMNTYYMTRNALLFFWRNSPSRYKWRAVAHILIRTMRTIGAWTFKPQYWNDTYRNLRAANIHALLDFTRGNFGQMQENQKHLI
jgi:GT2 family glycosyltransferase